MPKFLVQKTAAVRIKSIYQYTQETWGEKQAKAYINDLFQAFNDIADRKIRWQSVSADFEVRGYFTHFKKHYIYWKELESGEIGIVTVLHERMHQLERFNQDSDDTQ